MYSIGSLSELFLIVAFFSGSLAMPLVFDDSLLSSIWAIEGAGMAWIGVLQNRVLVRHFGIFLQFAAAWIFADLVWYPLYAIAFVNQYFLGCLLISFAALFSSYCFDMIKGSLKKWERYIPLVLLIWGLVWWYIAGLREIDRQLPAREVISGILLFCSASSIAMGLTIQKLNWPRFRLSLLVQLPVMGLLVLLSLIDSHSSFHLLRGSGAVAWTIAFGVQYRILYSYAADWPRRCREWYYIGSMWLLLYVVCHEAIWWVQQVETLAIARSYIPVFLYDSVIFQATIAALLGFVALVITAWATWRESRLFWLAGAVLLTMVLVKILMVDLAGSGTVARIISFLVAGILIFTIGCFLPFPPQPKEEDTSL